MKKRKNSDPSNHRLAVHHKSAECERCKREFTSECLVLDRRTSFNKVPNVCEGCEKCAELPPLPLPVKVTSEKKPEVETLRRLTEEGATGLRNDILPKLQALHTLADNGDQRALQLLADLAVFGAKHLQDIARRDPAVLRPVARKCVHWPSFIGPKKSSETFNRWLKTELQIGADVKGNWNPQAPTTMVAICMELWLRRNAEELKLPRLSKETLELWFEKGWDALMFQTLGKPEELAILKTRGNAAANKRLRPSASDHRSGIKVALRQSFRNYAKSRFNID